MDCCICSPMTAIYRPPRNTICSMCYDGAKGMIAFLKQLDSDQVLPENSASSDGSKPNPSIKGISDGFKWMKEKKEMEGRLNEKLGFLGSLVVALRDGMHTDILVSPGIGPPIPAHKAILAARSEIFRTMLGSEDQFKAPAEDTITLPELSHDELHCLLEFLYCGDLGAERAEKHMHSLLIAADKYDIGFLKDFCELRILKSLSPSNALEVLELSEVCSNRVLKEQAMKSVIEHVEDVAFSKKYDEFALKNANLCVEITRALLLFMKDKKVCV